MIVGILIGVILFLLGVLGATSLRAEGALREVRHLRARAHVSCMMNIETIISKGHDEALLLSLADKWDTVEEQGNLQVLAREHYTPGGPSIPALWLRQQADIIKRRPVERIDL